MSSPQSRSAAKAAPSGRAMAEPLARLDDAAVLPNERRERVLAGAWIVRRGRAQSTAPSASAIASAVRGTRTERLNSATNCPVCL